MASFKGMRVEEIERIQECCSLSLVSAMQAGNGMWKNESLEIESQRKLGSQRKDNLQLEPRREANGEGEGRRVLLSTRGFAQSSEENCTRICPDTLTKPIPS